jgi:phage I-like protein
MPWEVKSNGGKYCVYKIGSDTPIKGGCHDTEEEAQAHKRALYANYEGTKMSEFNFALSFAETAKVSDDDGLLWVEALPAKTWYTPNYGEVPITREKLENFVKNFNEGVRGQEVTTDYEHGIDPAKGRKASGTYRKFDIRPRADGTVSLWAGIEPTDTALAEIKAGEWKYFSLDWEDEWMHPETQQVHKDVVVGGALTNRPVAKGMLPINFSEVFVELSSEDAKKFSVWSTAYVNNLPDSSFFWVEAGSKDSEGKTVPRSKRHLPYKDANGRVDLAHVRNALARVNQVQGIPPAVVSRVKAMGAKLLKAKSMAEVLTIEAEHAPEYFQEPGTGIVDPGINEDDSFGDRIDTPPPGEDGSVPNRSDTVTKPNPEDSVMNEEQIAELRKALGLEEDADVAVVVSTAKQLSEEVEPLRELKKKQEQRKKFAEEYPDEAAELEKARKDREERFAKQFSETFATARVTRPVKVSEDSDETKNEPTTIGFSGRVIEEIEGMAKQFSEGTPTAETFKGVLDAILDNGIVDYGNRGSSNSDTDDLTEVDDTVPTSVTAIRKKFGEIVEKIMEEDKLDIDKALALAAERHPKLAEAWRDPGYVVN